MKKLTGCLTTDFENIQTEYYCLACESARNRDKAHKEREYQRWDNKTKLYFKCYEIMKTILRMINDL